MTVSRIVLALFFVIAGANHFLSPDFYLAITPPYLPRHAQLVAISGAAEIAGGLGVLFLRTRKLAGWGLIALLIAIFPANVYSIFSGLVIAGRAVPNWMLWARLPLQLAFAIWVYRVCLNSSGRSPAHSY
jgi:uncharacterized membrane protein